MPAVRSSVSPAPLRVAWIGPPPSGGGGVPGVGRLLLEQLAAQGLQIDCYTTPSPEPTPDSLLSLPGIRVREGRAVLRSPGWYDRESVGLTSFAGPLAMRALAQAGLGGSLLRAHRERRYDVIYQFSQIELLGVRRHLAELAPLVVHPQVHAAGEARWLRAERSLSRSCEPAWRSAAVATLMGVRARLQSRDLRLAALVIAPSHRFAQHLHDDYAVAHARLRVVPDPVDLHRFAPRGQSEAPAVLTVACVSRLAVRKGVELVVELARRCEDLRGSVRFVVAGEPSPWSDYRPLLCGLPPSMGEFVGRLGADEVAALLRASSVALVPSHYEPFGLVAAEALASGTPVVASDEVGAVEGIDSGSCRRFRAGDADDAERALREILARLPGGAAGFRAATREVAEARFDPVAVAGRVGEVLEQAARGGGGASPS